MNAESWKIRFSGKCNVMREKNSRLFKIARLLVRLDHVTSEPICRSRKNESVRADKRYLMVKRMLAVLPSLTTLMM
jgi:hypothetical protein